MAFVPADLDAIDTAIKSGELTVKFDDTSVTYRSMDELLKARGLIKREIQGPVRKTYSVASFSRE